MYMKNPLKRLGLTDSFTVRKFNYFNDISFLWKGG